jgi:hypothetical protein
MMKRALSILFALCVSGCASPNNGGPHHGEGPNHDHPHNQEHGGEHRGEHGDDHDRGRGHDRGPDHGDGQKHDMGAGMKAFHDVFAPPYHMEKGAPRDEKACAGLAGMKAAAGKIAAEPAGDPAAWKARSEALSRSLEGLEGACGAAGRAEVSARLEVVHDSFHALMRPEQHH